MSHGADTLNVSPDLEGQLRQAARTQGTDVTTYLLESARLRLRPDVLPEAEASLLQTINAPLAPEARVKRDALLAEQAHRHLTEEERDNLADLVDVVEMANARWWQALVTLVHLRGLSLVEVACLEPLKGRQGVEEDTIHDCLSNLRTSH